MSFTIPERVHFRHKFGRFGPYWQDAGNRRQAFYTNLGPGPYQFHVPQPITMAFGMRLVPSLTSALIPHIIKPSGLRLVLLGGLALLWFFTDSGLSKRRLRCIAGLKDESSNENELRESCTTVSCRASRA